MFSTSVMFVTMLICIAETSAHVIKDKAITSRIRLGSKHEVVCQSVQSVPLCQELGYDNTSFPNLRGHLTATEANQELADFVALIETGCSNAIVHLLCSIYAPPCLQAYSYLKYPPCRSLCEHVRDGCAATLSQYSNYDWPPGPHLNCSNYAKAENNLLCFGPTDLSILKIPRTSVRHPSNPPKNFTAMSLTPSTMMFSWDPSQSARNETYYLTCKPHQINFPYTTSKTVIKVGHFIPSTNYTCQVVLAHSTNITNSTTTIKFRTDPPLNITVRYLSPTSMALSWNNPDSKHLIVRSKTFPYMVLCQNRNGHITRRNTSVERVTLGNLQADSHYTCNISVPSSLAEYHEAAVIDITTLETLKLNFVGNTPDIQGNRVRISFQTNRPTTKLACRILAHRQKQDCSHHTARFHNVSAGPHTLRIVAENNKQDRLVTKRRIYVSGTSTACAVNLINNGIVQARNSITIFFKGTNSVDRLKCSLNKQEPFECSSPVLLRNFRRGKHQIKVTPTSEWCETSNSLSSHFTFYKNHKCEVTFIMN